MKVLNNIRCWVVLGWCGWFWSWSFIFIIWVFWSYLNCWFEMMVFVCFFIVDGADFFSEMNMLTHIECGF